ncbi:unnamed protein product, partial [Rotaria sp. Silwood2]
HKNSTWSDWPVPLRRHEQTALQTIRELEKDRIEYANEFKIKIIGDIPMYIDYDSVDVWSNSHIFQLYHNDTMKSTVLAGFPPDDISDTGQNWNMPIYDWNNEDVRKDLFDWWIKRLRRTLSTVDLLRFDHFRGLESHYVIPVDIDTQELNFSQAHWVKTPGYELLTAITETFGSDIPVIVEDLGNITSEVVELRDRFHLFGVKILQMGFYNDSENIYSPHNYIPNSVAYTGTHDYPTILQWWIEKASEKEKHQFIEYIRRPIDGHKELIDGLKLEKHVDKYICWYFIQVLLQSASNGTIIQMQDLLNIPTRMNKPGTASDVEHNGPQNWSWRFEWSQLTSDTRIRLKKLTQMYGRDLKYGKSIPSEDMAMKNDSRYDLQ